MIRYQSIIHLFRATRKARLYEEDTESSTGETPLHRAVRENPELFKARLEACKGDRESLKILISPDDSGERFLSTS